MQEGSAVQGARATPRGARRSASSLADDNLIVREGVRALIALEDDFSVVGTAADYDELVTKASELAPQVVVTDIRMPPTFQQEGIEAAHEIRKRHPGTGIVVLSQFDDPEYAISLLGEGSAGYAYLLKDRVAEGDQLARAVRAVAERRSVLDPSIVDAMVHPVTGKGELTAPRRSCSAWWRRDARSRPSQPRRVSRPRPPPTPSRSCSCGWPRTPAAAARTPCAACAASTRPSSTGRSRARRSSRLLPGGVAEMLREQGCKPGRDEGSWWSASSCPTSAAIRRSPRRPTRACSAGQLNVHRAEMNKAIIAAGGTVMQFVGDAVMAVFGAPVALDDHAGKGRGGGHGHARGAAQGERALAGRGSAFLRARASA